MEKNYINLMNAIVVQAADDYRMALKKLKRKPNNPDALKVKIEVEAFFRSEWFKCLTDVSPEYIMRKIQSEA